MSVQPFTPSETKNTHLEWLKAAIAVVTALVGDNIEATGVTLPAGVRQAEKQVLEQLKYRLARVSAAAELGIILQEQPEPSSQPNLSVVPPTPSPAANIKSAAGTGSVIAPVAKPAAEGARPTPILMPRTGQGAAEGAPANKGTASGAPQIRKGAPSSGLTAWLTKGLKNPRQDVGELQRLIVEASKKENLYLVPEGKVLELRQMLSALMEQPVKSGSKSGPKPGETVLTAQQEFLIRKIQSRGCVQNDHMRDILLEEGFFKKHGLTQELADWYYTYLPQEMQAEVDAARSGKPMSESTPVVGNESANQHIIDPLHFGFLLKFNTGGELTPNQRQALLDAGHLTQSENGVTMITDCCNPAGNKKPTQQQSSRPVPGPKGPRVLYSSTTTGGNTQKEKDTTAPTVAKKATTPADFKALTGVDQIEKKEDVERPDDSDHSHAANYLRKFLGNARMTPKEINGLKARRKDLHYLINERIKAEEETRLAQQQRHQKTAAAAQMDQGGDQKGRLSKKAARQQLVAAGQAAGK